MVLQLTELAIRLNVLQTRLEILYPYAEAWASTSPRSPYLNPVHYKIWGVMQEKVYKKKTHDVGDMRRCIIRAWDEFDHN